MYIVHQVLKVRAHWRQCIDRGLLISQQVVKLDNAHGDGLVLLGDVHRLFQMNILDNLAGHGLHERAAS